MEHDMADWKNKRNVSVGFDQWCQVQMGKYIEKKFKNPYV